jgi:hypothetical protein
MDEVICAVRLPAEIVKLADKAARRECQSRAAWIRSLILADLRARGLLKERMQ